MKFFFVEYVAGYTWLWPPMPTIVDWWYSKEQWR